MVAQGAEAPRYTLLETTRAYALEKLAQAGETAQLLTRHARVTLALFERAHDERWGERGALNAHDYNARVQPEVDNLRAGLAWARGGDEPALAVALAAALAQALDMVGLAAEGLAVLREFMPRVADAPEDPVAARFWFAATSLGTYGRIDDDDYLRALDLAEQGGRANGWIRRLYNALLMRAWWHVRKYEFSAAEAALAQAEAVEHPQWPGWLRSDYWNARTYLMVQRGDYALLPATHQKIASLLPIAGEEGRRARLIVNMAVDCAYRQQWQEAVTLLEPALDQARERRRPAGNVAWGLGILVLALAELGRLDAARERLRQGLPLWRADDIVRVWLPAAIRLLAAEGRIAAAARLLGANEGGEHKEGSGGLMARVDAESLRLIEAAEPDAAQRECWRREGEALTEDEIAALCLGDANSAR